MGARRWAARVLVGLLALGLTAACGVSTQGAPEPLSSGDLVNAGEAVPDTATPMPSESPAVSSATQVFLLREGRLVAVGRSVSNADIPGPVLDALLAGPTKAEAASSITSAIPAGTPSLDVTVVERGTALVAVPPRFATLALTAQILVVAQLVYTVTGVGGITGLQMTDGSEIVDVPNEDGQLVRGPVSRATYRALAPSVGATASSPAG